MNQLLPLLREFARNTGGVSVLLLASVTAYASGTHCTAIRADKERLACFDKAYDTPIHVDPLPLPTSVSVQTFSGLIWEQEKNREEGDVGLQMTTSMEHTDAEQERVIISGPALGAVGVRPLLAANCIDNITRVQLILPQPTSASRINVQLRGEDGGVIISELWRTSERGHTIDAGRGIHSIRLLQQLLASRRITIDSDETMINGIRFDIERLPTHIKHLQRACHWR